MKLNFLCFVLSVKDVFNPETLDCNPFVSANHNDLIGRSSWLFQILIFLELLGKQVSFSWLGADGVTYKTDGQFDQCCFHLESSSEFTVDDGEYFSF